MCLLGSRFAVDRTTGVLSTSLPLLVSDRSTYDFSVRARDTSSPYYETICRVNVIVFSQETTNRPIFIQPPSESTIYRIYEVFQYFVFLSCFRDFNIFGIATRKDSRAQRYINIKWLHTLGHSFFKIRQLLLLFHWHFFSFPGISF